MRLLKHEVVVPSIINVIWWHLCPLNAISYAELGADECNEAESIIEPFEDLGIIIRLVTRFCFGDLEVVYW